MLKEIISPEPRGILSNKQHLELRSKHMQGSTETLREMVDPGDVDQSFSGYSTIMPPPLARKFVDWMYYQFKKDLQIGYEDRNCYVQSIPGHYGLAGYVFTIEGSPTRGTMYVEIFDAKRIYLMKSGKILKASTSDSSSSAAGKRHREAFWFLDQLNLPIESGSDARVNIQ